MKTSQKSALARHAPAIAVAAGFAALLGAGAAQAQSLTVLPVNITMPPGQLATTMTVINQGKAETSVQVRVLAWEQPGGAEKLTPSDSVLISPPIVTIAPGASQVVRLVMTHPETTREATYRILLDQIPPAASPGTVRIALRLSIPVFAEPMGRADPHIAFHIQKDGDASYLVAENDGEKHETVRDVALTTSGGVTIKTASDASPYILAGATHRWRILDSRSVPDAGSTLLLTAKADTGAVSKTVAVVATK